MEQIFNFVWIALNETPTWVYIVFALIVFMGIKASKAHTLPLVKLFVAPVVFSYLTVDTIIHYVKFDLSIVALLLLFASVGATIGYFYVRSLSVQIDKEHKLVSLPGSWSVLVVGMLIFAIKYYYGYALAQDPGLLENTIYEVIYLLVSGICSGIFIGKVLKVLALFCTEESVDLTTKL